MWGNIWWYYNHKDTCSKKYHPDIQYLHNEYVQEDVKRKYSRCWTKNLVKIKILGHIPTVTNDRKVTFRILRLTFADNKNAIKGT